MTLPFFACPHRHSNGHNHSVGSDTQYFDYGHGAGAGREAGYEDYGEFREHIFLPLTVTKVSILGQR